MTRDQWDATLTWMTERHGMPNIHDAERALILDYLATHHPPKAPAGAGGFRNPFAPQYLCAGTSFCWNPDDHEAICQLLAIASFPDRACGDDRLLQQADVRIPDHRGPRAFLAKVAPVRRQNGTQQRQKLIPRKGKQLEPTMPVQARSAFPAGRPRRSELNAVKGGCFRPSNVSLSPAS